MGRKRGKIDLRFLSAQANPRPHKGRQTAAVPSQPPPSDGLTVHSVTNAVQARLKKDLHKYTVLLNTQSNSRPLG